MHHSPPHFEKLPSFPLLLHLFNHKPVTTHTDDDARTLSHSLQSNSKQHSTQQLNQYVQMYSLHAFTKTLQKDSQLLASMDAAFVVVAAAFDRPAAYSFASSSFVAAAVVVVVAEG